MTLNPRPKWGSGGNRLLPPLQIVGGVASGGTISGTGVWKNWGMPATNFLAPKWATKMRVACDVQVHGDTSLIAGRIALEIDTVVKDEGYFYIDTGYVTIPLVEPEHDVVGGTTYSIRTRHIIDSGTGQSNASFGHYRCMVWWERSP